MGSNLKERTEEVCKNLGVAVSKLSEAKGHEETPADIEEQLNHYEEYLRKLSRALSRVPEGAEHIEMGGLKGDERLYDVDDAFGKVLNACYSGWHAFNTARMVGEELDKEGLEEEFSSSLLEAFESFKDGETLEQLTMDWEDTLYDDQPHTDDEEGPEDLASFVRSIGDRVGELEARCDSLERELEEVKNANPR